MILICRFEIIRAASVERCSFLFAWSEDFRVLIRQEEGANFIERLHHLCHVCLKPVLIESSGILTDISGAKMKFFLAYL